MGDPITAALGELGEHAPLPYVARVREVAPEAFDARPPRSLTEDEKRQLAEADAEAERRNREVVLGMLRVAVAELIDLGDEPHVCSCDHVGDAGGGCSEAFEDRCRFEAALRHLAGEVPPA